MLLSNGEFPTIHKGLRPSSTLPPEKVFDAQWGPSNPGTNVAQWSGNGSRAQKWKIVTGDKGHVTIISVLDSSIVLDISGARCSAGANVQVSRANGSAAQVLRSFQQSHR